MNLLANRVTRYTHTESNHRNIPYKYVYQLYTPYINMYMPKLCNTNPLHMLAPYTTATPLRPVKLATSQKMQFRLPY